MKEKFGFLGAYFLVGLVFILIWYYLYTASDNYEMYYHDNGMIDTSQCYLVEPKYTKIKKFNEKTMYYFYDRDKNFIIAIDKDSLKYYCIINME